MLPRMFYHGFLRMRRKQCLDDPLLGDALSAQSRNDCPQCCNASPEAFDHFEQVPQMLHKFCFIIVHVAPLAGCECENP